MPSHSERRFLPYSRQDIFDLVADVGSYPEFLPWCVAARVRPQSPETFEADLVIGFRMVRETFTSRVDLNRPERIDVTYTRGPMRHLHNHWRLEAVEGGCIIDFDVAFEFKSRVLQGLIGGLFGEAVRRMVAAFEARARATCEPISDKPPQVLA